MANRKTANRYQRQSILPQIGETGQQRLADARVLLIGCGALGSALAEILVRAGVGFLRIVDRDLVEMSNLQRQLLFDESDAQNELPKSVAAATRLAKINSNVQVEPIVADANAGNIEQFADVGKNRPVDLILDGTDNVATRYLINDLAVKFKISWIYGACVGVNGRVMAVVPHKTACLRCVFPQPPAAAELPTCDTAGVLGPAALAVAAIQAASAMRLLVGAGPTPSGLASFDLWSGEFRNLPSATHPDPNCPCCGEGQFPYLSKVDGEFITTLCGRSAVQVSQGNASAALDLPAAAERLQTAGLVHRSAWFVRCALREPAGIDLTLFPDGRLLVHGTTDPMRARSIYARFIGS